MKLMLDTNICIYIIKQQPESVLERFLDYQVGDISILDSGLRSLDFALWTLASGARGAQRSSAASNGLFATISPLNR